MDYICLIVPLMAKDGRLAKSLAVGKSPGFFLQMNEYQSWLKSPRRCTFPCNLARWVWDYWSHLR